MTVFHKDLLFGLAVFLTLAFGSLLLLHLCGVFPGVGPVIPLETVLKTELQDINMACIAAVHEIGTTKGDSDREQQLRGAIEISAKIVAIEKKLADLAKQDTDPSEIKNAMRPEIKALGDLINRASVGTEAFAAAKYEVNELIKQMEK